MAIMMKCGHSANAVNEHGKPSCAICAGLTPNADIVDDTPLDLSKRKAKCSDCGTIKQSSTDLAFFGHKPDREYDSFYCGCRGWN